MRPRKGMTAQKIVNILEKREARFRDSAKSWERLGEPYMKLVCEKTAETIRDLLREIAE